MESGRSEVKMKSRLMLITIALASIGVGACGNAGKVASSASHAAPGALTTGGAGATSISTATSTPRGFARDNDDDNDSRGNSYYDEDDNVILRYGHSASAADVQAVTAIVKRYYAAAAAGDGVKGCSLIYSLFAETIPEEYGRPPAGPPGLRGKTCAVIVSKLFKQNHRQLVADNTVLKVTGVRVEGNRGWAVLSLQMRSAHRILVHRERGAWKIDELLDSEMP
jgi:hypothetical protein